MAIYRGTGGSGDSTQDSTLNEITQQAINAADSATAASNSASNASTSAGQSSTSATNASNAATQSALSATGSSASKDTSVAQATVATTKASEAATSATNSAASASTASTQATNSANSATASASSASTASTQATLATTNGAAQVALATTQAGLATTNGAAQVTLATAQASIATTKASEAATSATNSATSNTNSGNSATASANSATAAASSASGASTSASMAAQKASEAATSATNAASSLATFTGQYVSQSSAPSSPSTGDLWFDTSASIMKVYNGSGWVSAGSSVSGVQNSVQYTATSNQTSFNATYDAGYLQVYLNGIRLDAEDYTATNGSTVVLDTGATVNDVVFIHSFGTFELADHYNKVASDARYEPIDSAYTKAEADANLAALVDSSPAALNTLNELAAALGDDANFSTTVTNSIATKLPKAGGTMTGVIAGFESTGIDDNATSTAITIDASENVGIGTSSPVSPNVAGTFVEIEDAVAASLVINDTGQANPYELIAGGDKFSLRYGDADLAVFKNSGNVGIGVVPEAWTSTRPALQIGTQSSLSSYNTDGRTLLSTNAYHDSVSNRWEYIANDHAMQYEQYQGLHRFQVAASGTADSAISWTTAMTINNGGKLTVAARAFEVGTFSSTGASAGVKHNIWSNNEIGIGSSVASSSGQSHYAFYNTNGQVGYIQTSGSSTIYSTSSDYRLKENVTPMSGATAQTKLLKPCNFDWIAGGNVNGFLAHELAEVVPEAVTGTKDAMRDEDYEVTPAVVDDEGNETTAAVMGTRSVPDMQGIDQAKLVPLLTATIQELIARIEALEGAAP